MVAGEVGNFVYAARVGFHYRANDEDALSGDFKLGSEISLGAAVGWQFLDKKLLVGPEFNAGTVVTQGGSSAFEKLTSPAEVMLGLRYGFESGVALAGGAGLGLWRALGTPEFRGILSLGYSMPYVAKVLDRDSDGVADDQDACPDVPGKPSKNPERHGCPPVFMKGEQIVIQDQIRFVTNSSKIAKTKLNGETLSAVKKILDDNPRVKSVRVEGHTDNVGKATYNQKLSSDRARAVVEWLVKGGIDAARLSSEGVGMDRPIADNKTAKGRAANRRVEFHIVEVQPEVW